MYQAAVSAGNARLSKGPTVRPIPAHGNAMGSGQGAEMEGCRPDTFMQYLDRAKCIRLRSAQGMHVFQKDQRSAPYQPMATPWGLVRGRKWRAVGPTHSCSTSIELNVSGCVQLRECTSFKRTNGPPHTSPWQRHGVWSGGGNGGL